MAGKAPPPVRVEFTVTEALLLRDELNGVLNRVRASAAGELAPYPELVRLVEYDATRFERAIRKIELAIARHSR